MAALGSAAAALYPWLQLEYEPQPKNLAPRIVQPGESTESERPNSLFGYGGDEEDEEKFFSRWPRLRYNDHDFLPSRSDLI